MRITHSFEGLNIPTIPITVRGPVAAYGDHQFNAGVDAGFTAFLSLPFFDAVKPGLIFSGVMPLTLADGKPTSFLYCLGQVQIGEKQEIGVIVISPSDDALVGMEFLRQFGFHLEIDPTANTVTLDDHLAEELPLDASPPGDSPGVSPEAPPAPPSST
ncbi:MAG: hypothetical protein AB1792_07105 [Candidatus Zixiibacteriota bacterium]